MSTKSEILDYYDRDGTLLWTDLRTKILAAQEQQSRERGDTDISVDCVMLFLINTDNQVYISKRASNKAENPNLWDKTLGGHVVSGDSFDTTVKKELDEELSIDAEVLKNSADFSERLKNPTDLTQKAIITRVTDIHNYQSKRVTQQGDTWNKRMNVGLYIGFYNGEVSFKDGEVAESKFISLHDLETEIQKNPDMYTDDILKLIKEHAVLNTILVYSKKAMEILNKTE